MRKKMTIQQLKNEIETVHRAWYPESDEQVWPLCLAKLVEEIGEHHSDLNMEELADIIIAITGAYIRCPMNRRVGFFSLVSALETYDENTYWYRPESIVPEWLEYRWNEVKQRPPEVQRRRDRERGIEIEEDMNR